MVLLWLLSPRCADGAVLHHKQSLLHARVFCVFDCSFRKASARELQTHGAPQEITARLVDAAGAPANVGLLQVQTGDGSFGTVCGMNLEAVDVVCRQLGPAYILLC